MQLKGIAIRTLILAMMRPALYAQMPDNTSAASQNTVIRVDAKAQGTPFPHYWEQVFGSGRAILSLRESYRNDLHMVKEATGFQAIRFHGIFHDEVGFFDLDAGGHPVYNFSYIDQIYDGLLANGVRPFVELP